MLRILYKLFSRLLNGRLQDILDKAQPVEQAGFRAGFGVEDHLFTMVMLIEASSEYNVPFWACAVDFRKAFDTVDHESLWSALSKQGVPRVYIRTLAKLYEHQSAKVVADQTSKAYKVKRGTKQGDPLSPKLFNAVMHEALKAVQSTWKAKKFGIAFGSHEEDYLCSLQFADDVVLLATSKRTLRTMISDLKHAAMQVGLELHMGKTKVLTNTGSTGYLDVAGDRVDIVESTEYLGRTLSFRDSQSVEVGPRIAKGWKKFMALKQELCSNHYPLKQRLRFFNCSVTPTVLFGSCAWTLTADLERKLRTTQRRMLRWMIGVGRQRAKSQPDQDTASESSEDHLPDENRSTDCDEDGLEAWAEWIQRATRIAEAQLDKAGIEDWVTLQRRTQYRWAGHAARRTDARWSQRVLDWLPKHGRRTVGRPKRRWADSINDFFMKELGSQRDEWMIIAHCRETWKSFEDGFSRHER
jgi:hypothetical protein